jgi:hypothetical protein
MKYLCIVHLDHATFSAMSEDEIAALERSNLAYDAELTERHRLVAGHGLEPPESGLIVKARSNDVSMTDGPFSEAKEQMAGIILVEARDMNEAGGIAAGIPLAKHRHIEVRPVYTIPNQARSRVGDRP